MACKKYYLILYSNTAEQKVHFFVFMGIVHAKMTCRNLMKNSDLNFVIMRNFLQKIIYFE